MGYCSHVLRKEQRGDLKPHQWPPHRVGSARVITAVERDADPETRHE